MPTMGSSKRRSDATQSRARILDAAVEVFRRDGAGASLEEVARHAGVGSATLHRHFRGRAALLEALFADTVDKLAAKAGDFARDRGDDEALWAWLDWIVGRCAEDSALAEALGGSPAELVERWAPLKDAGAGLMQSAVAAGSLRPDVSISELLGLVDAIATSCAGHPADASRLLSLVRHGTRPSS